MDWMYEFARGVAMQTDRPVEIAASDNALRALREIAEEPPPTPACHFSGIPIYFDPNVDGIEIRMTTAEAKRRLDEMYPRTPH